MSDKQKLSDFLLIKLQECKLKPYGGAIYGDAADYIAEQLVCAGYRKQSDVIKEFVEKVKDKFFYELDSERSINPVSIYRFTDKEIDELAAEFGAKEELR